MTNFGAVTAVLRRGKNPNNNLSLFEKTGQITRQEGQAIVGTFSKNKIKFNSYNLYKVSERLKKMKLLEIY